MHKNHTDALDRNTAIRALGIAVFFCKDEVHTIISALLNMLF